MSHQLLVGKELTPKQAVQAMLSKSKSLELFDDQKDSIRSFFKQDEGDKVTSLASKPYKRLIKKLSQQDSDLYRKVVSKKLKSTPLPDNQTRKQIWMAMSGADNLKRIQPDSFKQLASQEGSNPSERQIMLDVKRTIGKQNLELQMTMSRVLVAYSRRNCNVGYCQGLNFIVLSLLRAGLQEDEAFWMMCALIELMLPLDYYTNMVGVVCDQKILNSCIGCHRPALAEHMKSISLQTSLFTVQWVVCLFSNILSQDFVTPLWDRLFVDGVTTLFKASLVLIQLLEAEILASQDFATAIGRIDKTVARLQVVMTPQEFIKRVDSLYVSRSGLDACRAIFRQKLYEVTEKGHAPGKYRQPCCLSQHFCLKRLEKIRQRGTQIEYWPYRQGKRPIINQQYWTKRSFYGHSIDTSQTRYQTLSIHEEELIKRERSLQQVVVRHEHECSDAGTAEPESCQFELKELSIDKGEIAVTQSMAFFDNFAGQHHDIAALMNSVIQ